MLTDVNVSRDITMHRVNIPALALELGVSSKTAVDARPVEISTANKLEGGFQWPLRVSGLLFATLSFGAHH